LHSTVFFIVSSCHMEEKQKWWRWFKKCKLTLVTKCTLNKLLTKKAFYKSLKFKFSPIIFMSNLSQREVHIFRISIKVRIFWYPHWSISRFEKISDPNFVDSEKFGHQECNFCKKLLKMKENVFGKQVIDFV
jgi:hypothetical protein